MTIDNNAIPKKGFSNSKVLQRNSIHPPAGLACSYFSVMDTGIPIRRTATFSFIPGAKIGEEIVFFVFASLAYLETLWPGLVLYFFEIALQHLFK